MTIEVPMDVTRYEIHRECGMVTVWGYVGDYEVMCPISIRDAIEKDLIPDGDYLPKDLAKRYGK